MQWNTKWIYFILSIYANNLRHKDIKVPNSLQVSINKYIQTNCNHDFVEDYIDIQYDLTQKIIYCDKCYFEPKNFKIK